MTDATRLHEDTNIGSYGFCGKITLEFGTDETTIAIRFNDLRLEMGLDYSSGQFVQLSPWAAKQCKPMKARAILFCPCNRLNFLQPIGETGYKMRPIAMSRGCMLQPVDLILFFQK